MLLVRALADDKTSMGVWALYLSIITIFEMVKQGLLRNPTIKFLGLSEYAGKKKEVQSSALAMNVTFSIIVIIIVLASGSAFAAAMKAPALAPMLWWSTVFVLLLIPFNHYEVLLQANYLFQRIFWGYIVRQGVFFAGVAGMFFFFRSSLTLLHLVLLQIVSLSSGVIVLYAGASSYRIKGFHYDGKILRRMFAFGKYIFGTNLFSNVARYFDHFITANALDPISGKEFVSYYNAVSRINNMMDVPSLAAADVLFPKNVETLETHGLGRVKYYFERMMGTILSIVVPLSLFIFIFPGFIVHIIAGGRGYEGVIPILQLTILFNLNRPLGYQFGSTLDAVGKPVVNFWTSAGLMVFGLISTYFFLNHFGGIGAAYATVLNNIVSCAVMVLILKKFIHLEVRNIFRYVLTSYQDMYLMVKKVVGRKDIAASQSSSTGNQP